VCGPRAAETPAETELEHRVLGRVRQEWRAARIGAIYSDMVVVV
jgi:hypothetical protein